MEEATKGKGAGLLGRLREKIVALAAIKATVADGEKFIRIDRHRDGSAGLGGLHIGRKVCSPAERAYKAKRKKANKLAAHNRMINHLRAA